MGKTDDIGNKGVCDNPCVLRKNYGLRVIFIPVTTFHAELKGNVKIIENESWMSWASHNTN